MTPNSKPWMLSNVYRILRSYTLRQLVTRVFEEYCWWIVRSLPGFGGVYLRYLFLKLTTKRLDGFCWVSRGCTIVNAHGLSIGREFAINQNVLIDAIGGIEIGDKTGIGPNTVIISAEHSMLGRSGYYAAESYRQRPIRIGSRVWIGANSFVKCGVTIGDGAIIGACTNVVADVPGGKVMIGSVARNYTSVMREIWRETAQEQRKEIEEPSCEP